VGAIMAHGVLNWQYIMPDTLRQQTLQIKRHKGAHRVNPASAGYHEIRPKPILGQYTPYRIYFTRQKDKCQVSLHKK
jgi:hypothetical protein